MNNVNINGRLVGENAPVFIIAEAGVNHNGDIEMAKKMVIAAKKSGADAIKFQSFKSESIVSKHAEKAEYQKKTTGTGSQYEMIKKLELSKSEFEILSQHALENDIIFLSSPFDIESANELDQLGIGAFKIASGEITNHPLLKCVSSKNKPIILSTGMASLDDIKEALNTMDSAKDIILLHCVTSYPTKLEDMNLKVIKSLRESFQLNVGFSDHSLASDAPVLAVALGACIIEKHFTLDKNLPGPDHKSSLSPSELREMVMSIRETEIALGTGIKKLTKEEEENKKIARKSIVARVGISKGQIISEDMLDYKRPGTGLEPKHTNKLIGKKALRDMMADDIIMLDMVGDSDE